MSDRVKTHVVLYVLRKAFIVDANCEFRGAGDLAGPSLPLNNENAKRSTPPLPCSLPSFYNTEELRTSHSPREETSQEAEHQEGASREKSTESE